MKKLNLSEAYYKKAIQYRPKMALSYLNLGALFEKTERIDKAIEVIFLLALVYKNLVTVDFFSFLKSQNCDFFVIKVYFKAETAIELFFFLKELQESDRRQ